MPPNRPSPPPPEATEDRARAGAATEPTLEEFVWQARPVVLLAPSADDPRIAQARATIEAARVGFDRRDMMVLVVSEPGHPLGKRFGVPDYDFAAILVGKDGEETARRQRLDDLGPWFALIDTTPMRQREMRQRGETSASR